MVQPDRKRQNRYRHRGDDKRIVAVEPLGRKGRKNLGVDTVSRQNQQVDFGVSEQPEQIGIIHHVAAEVVGEKMEIQIAISGQQQRRDAQGRHGKDDQDRTAYDCPAIHRQPHESHSRRAHLVDRNGEIDPGERCANTRNNDRPNPVVRPNARIEGCTGIRRVGRPATGREPTHHQRNHKHHARGHCQAQADLVQPRKRHVPRADHQRNYVVRDAKDKGHRDKENHDRAMGTEQLGEVFSLQEAIAWSGGLLRAHDDALQHATRQHHDGEDDIHDPNLLVIDTGQPIAPKGRPQPKPAEQADHDDNANQDNCGSGVGNDLICVRVLD